jgi:hypothetical protein
VPDKKHPVERLRAAVSRFLALDDAYGIVDHFKKDWATSDRHGELVEIARDRMKETLAEAEHWSE